MGTLSADPILRRDWGPLPFGIGKENLGGVSEEARRVSTLEQGWEAAARKAAGGEGACRRGLELPGTSA